MLAFPMPLLSCVLAAVACVLVWRMDIGSTLARGLFTGVFALMAAGTLLTGLRFGYAIDAFAPIQRIIPLAVGPLLYLGFTCFTRAEMTRPLAMHLGIAAIAATVPQAIPGFRGAYDGLILLSYLFYALAILRLWSKGPDALSRAPLDITAGLRTWMLVASAMLSVMLVFDTAIAISFALERRAEALTLITYGSLVSALSMIAAIVVISNRSAPVAAPQPATPNPLEPQARAFLTESQLFLETDLTLDRLAKRLHVPARALSEAINQTQRMNVSQYVNGFRLTHAAHLLETTELSVTGITEQAGFLTRSNFYREFERVYATSPTAYRRAKRS